ncbi:hypothetical protein QZH41_007466 [Actinostola sp. cb2023]|nr:hypothetical protein QZH41_007466 [Actinostola sp. cb2023]
MDPLEYFHRRNDDNEGPQRKLSRSNAFRRNVKSYRPYFHKEQHGDPCSMMAAEDNAHSSTVKTLKRSSKSYEEESEDDDVFEEEGMAMVHYQAWQPATKERKRCHSCPAMAKPRFIFVRGQSTDDFAQGTAMDPKEGHVNEQDSFIEDVTFLDYLKSSSSRRRGICEEIEKSQTVAKINGCKVTTFELRQDLADRVVNGVLETNVALPGLVVQLSSDDGRTWSDVRPGLAVAGKITLVTRMIEEQYTAHAPQGYLLPGGHGIKTDVMPNWYIAAERLQARTVTSTTGEELDFVGLFDDKKKWKRYPSDRYNPYTAQERYEMAAGQEDMGKAAHVVLPSPLNISKYDVTKIVDVRTGDWIVVAPKELTKEAQFLAGELGINEVTTGASNRVFRLIQLKTHDIKIGGNISRNKEAYELSVESSKAIITISGSHPSGVFWGVQSLLSITREGRVPSIHIVDAPRYEFRGMHIDVARNFFEKKEIFKLINVMSMYKLNKLHLHLTDDEGWRLEIPGLPELTKVRVVMGIPGLPELTKVRVVMGIPGLPELTKVRVVMGIPGLPELTKVRVVMGIPGLPELTKVGGKRCHDPKEESCIASQLGSGPFTGNTGSGFYTTRDYQDILRYANDRHVQVIPEFDMPGHAHAAIMAMDARGTLFTVCLISHRNMVWTWQPWEDGLLGDDEAPYQRSYVMNTNIYANAWDNVWEWGKATRPYKLANAGYKVVMTQATHLYFDHPYEPDPEERGYYWASRFIDTRKTFGFMPDNLYANADFTRMGDPIVDLCNNMYKGKCEKLRKPENIVGMSGAVWTETIRTPDELDSMIYPRLLALAERAWCKSAWESEINVARREEMKRKDWGRFVNTLGYKELSRLDKLNVAYRVPPPGANICIPIGREPTDNSNCQCAPAIFQRFGGYLQKRACVSGQTPYEQAHRGGRAYEYRSVVYTNSSSSRIGPTIDYNDIILRVSADTKYRT